MIDYNGLPESLRGGTGRWIESGVQPGSFLMAVICNNLKEAFARADDDNRRDLFHIVGWFYNEAPMPCWGSVSRARNWAERYGRTIELEWLEETS